MPKIGAPLVELDFNYAYNPSCAYDHRWACPLAPQENWLGVAVSRVRSPKVTSRASGAPAGPRFGGLIGPRGGSPLPSPSLARGKARRRQRDQRRSAPSARSAARPCQLTDYENPAKTRPADDIRSVLDVTQDHFTGHSCLPPPTPVIVPPGPPPPEHHWWRPRRGAPSLGSTSDSSGAPSSLPLVQGQHDRRAELLANSGVTDKVGDTAGWPTVPKDRPRAWGGVSRLRSRGR